MTPPFPVRTPEQVVREFCAETLAREADIRRVLGDRWDPLFQAIRLRSRGMAFSDDQSDAAFHIDPVTGRFTFYNGGFYALRAALVEVVGSGSGLEGGYLCEIADAAYALHELYHPEQGLSRFSVVQDHKRVPMGKDEIGKIDHHADNIGTSLVAAVLSARAGTLSRLDYLQRLRDLLVLLNLAAPVAFGVPDEALNKQKRRLANWMVAARIDDALAYGMVREIEQEIGPLDRALWMHFQEETGDIVVWEPEPLHRVLGTAKVSPEVLVKALKYRKHMDCGAMFAVIRMFLQALRIDAVSVGARQVHRLAPPQVS